ncbi:MAG: NUDIX hydrolase [Oscillospiraceae bacterium]|nr:NUDIX hydrolase [Oscillospiraceae bacterium]
MSIENLKEKIEKYQPYNEQEKVDKQTILEYINDFDNILTRDNKYAHFSGSAFVVNRDRTKMMVIHHNQFKSYTMPGGHADGENDLLKTAIRELQEETGIENIVPVDNDIFSLEIFAVNGHMKEGKWVSGHAHLNLLYILEADENEVTRIKPDENSDVKWVNIDDVVEIHIGDWTRKNYFNKAIKKLKEEHVN